MSAGWQKKTLCTAKWVCGEICRCLIIHGEMEARVFLLTALYLPSYISCTQSLCGSAGGEVRASTLTDPQFLSSSIKSVLAKIAEHFWSLQDSSNSSSVSWVVSSSFLPQSKNMPVRLIGNSKFALAVIVWEKVVCFLWWTPCPGCIPAFHPVTSGTESSTHRDPDWD